MPRKLTPAQIKDAHADYMAGVTIDDLAHYYGVAHSTLQRGFSTLGLRGQANIHHNRRYAMRHNISDDSPYGLYIHAILEM